MVKRYSSRDFPAISSGIFSGIFSELYEERNYRRKPGKSFETNLELSREELLGKSRANSGTLEEISGGTYCKKSQEKLQKKPLEELR